MKSLPITSANHPKAGYICSYCNMDCSTQELAQSFLSVKVQQVCTSTGLLRLLIDQLLVYVYLNFKELLDSDESRHVYWVGALVP